MKEERFISQNGRWGVTLLLPDDVSVPTHTAGSVMVLGRGRFIEEGKVAGRDVYRFAPCSDGALCAVVMAECTDDGVVTSRSLQGGDYVSLVALHPGQMVQVWGTDRRGSRYRTPTDDYTGLRTPTDLEVLAWQRRQIEHLIVTRHPGALDWLHQEYPEFADTPVLESVTAEDVAGKIVIGNLPLSLASAAFEVWAIEFDGPAPRGSEYTADDMRAAGAKLSRYYVTKCE